MADHDPSNTSRPPAVIKLLVLANNLTQASYRVRVAALLPLFHTRGIAADVKLRTGWVQRWRSVRSARDYDAVLLQRKFLDPWEARLLRRAGRPVFYDIDDALMFHNRPVGIVSRWRTRRRFRATLAGVDHVVAGNEYLADIFRRGGRPATVLPTVVDPARYIVKQHVPSDTVRLVWIGSRSTLPYLRQAIPALRQAESAAKVAGVTLKLLTIADETLKPSECPLPVEHAPWSADTEAASLVRGDIGIAPTPTDPWTLGKCGFKIVQYMAAGLPVVASPVGANAELVSDGSSGFLPSTDQQWGESIARLASDVGLRRQMGERGRDMVEERLSIAHVADEWASLVRKSVRVGASRAEEHST